MASLDHLHRFHDRHAGASDGVFGGADSGDGRPSYDRLADCVPTDAERILDLACGDGPLLQRLRRPGRVLTGLDANASELGAAARRLGDDVRLVQGLAQDLPFDDGAFDVVTSHMALMLMDDIERVLAEIRRVLRPGGTLAFVVGRSAPANEAERPVWEWLGDRWRVEGLQMDLGDPRWSDDAGTRELLLDGFADLELVPLDLRVEVSAVGLFAFLERAYYPVDALSEDGKRAFAAFLSSFARAGTVSWTFAVVLGRCRARRRNER